MFCCSVLLSGFVWCCVLLFVVVFCCLLLFGVVYCGPLLGCFLLMLLSLMSVVVNVGGWWFKRFVVDCC